MTYKYFKTRRKGRVRLTKDSYCKLCGLKLVKDDVDVFGEFAYCPKMVRLPNRKTKSHFSYNAGELVMHILPYKLVNFKDESKIMILNPKAKKSSVIQFKTVAKVSTIEPLSEDQLFKKLKLLVILS